ncbi:hypothetical protein [Aneurinibacillus aneurinilyticus]|uniref:Uncharacterized protein n=1 Tax=Aneurinibacillus aneurinilyticus TaxID=1391 RepID=A0A848D2F7_ANEAE|nr:hypothetical protein [Aneurinibacillus aneurinilyticus]NMF00233.1 hypothetical protein [Aneurinibacillus aneurinilyticus]
MKTVLQSMDVGPIGTVTLSNGQKFDVPRLTNLKIIQIAKFVGVDGSQLYRQFKFIMSDETIDESEKLTMLFMNLPEEAVIRILAILLEIEAEQALQLDPVETLEIIEVYVDKANLGKAFTLVRSLTKKMFNFEIPDMKMILERIKAEAPGNESSNSLSEE